jgi:hypothetical protein
MISCGGVRPTSSVHAGLGPHHVSDETVKVTFSLAFSRLAEKNSGRR